jgi:hypothetical protein
MWQNLLINIKSPSAQALLKLANPVKIASDEVIITFKNEKLVSQINDSNKKQLIIEAANVIFNQTDSKVVVRMPQSGDDKLVEKPTAQPSVKKMEVMTEKTSEQNPVMPEKSDSVKIDSDKKTDNAEKTESDQEKMVLELFDGKYVE